MSNMRKVEVTIKLNRDQVEIIGDDWSSNGKYEMDEDSRAQLTLKGYISDEEIHSDGNVILRGEVILTGIAFEVIG